MSQPTYRLLQEMAEILKGKATVKTAEDQKEKFLLFDPKNMQAGKLVATGDSVFVEKQDDLIYLQERDFVFYRNGGKFGLYFITENDPPCCLAEPSILIRSSYSNYLDIFFKSELGKKLLQGHFSLNDPASDLAILKDLKIPMLNESILKQLQSKAIEKFSEEDLAKMKKAISSVLTGSAVGASVGGVGAGVATISAGASLIPLVGSIASIGAIAGAALGGSLGGLFKKNKQEKAAPVEKTEQEETEVTAAASAAIIPPVPAADTVFRQVETEMKKFLETGQLDQPLTEDTYRLQQLYMLREIYNLTKSVDRKIDLVLQALEQLQSEVEDIRKTDRSMEEKIQLISSKVDQRLRNLNETIKDDIQAYRDMLKRMISHWDDLDPLSQEFLPFAEYLYDKLAKMEDADFSPVILQYCRSLENELLQKLFVGFCLYLYEKEKNLKVFLAADFQNENTKRFAQPIYERRNKPKDIQFTLGAMRLVLVLAKREEIVETSPLLKEFRYYLKHAFREQFILTDEYIKQLQKIVDEYRNKCAHPYKLGKEKASQCRDMVPQCLNRLLEGFE